MARIHIPSPCQADWEAMEGSSQKRFCNQCSKHVHDLSAMTKAQADKVLEVPNVCVRFREDGQGQILHAPASSARSPRLPRWLALGVLLGASSALAAPAVEQDQTIPEAEVGWVEWVRQQLQSLVRGDQQVISQGEVEMGQVAVPEPPLTKMGEVAPAPPPPPVIKPAPPPLMGKPVLIQPSQPPPPQPEPLPRPEPGESVIPEVEEALKQR